MSHSRVSRRAVLGGLVFAGSTGAVVGTGTGAVITDWERMLSDLDAGTLDVHVEWAGGSTSGAVPLEIDATAETRRGSERIGVSLPDDGSNNPARVWLAATCPASPELADALSFTLSTVDCDAGSVDEVLASGSLRSVAETLADGIRLDSDADSDGTPCFQPGSRRCLELAWELDAGYTGTGTTAFELLVAARQCRRTAPTDNPFADRECSVPPADPPDGYHGISYVEIYACDESGDAASRAGKLELEAGYCGADGIGENVVEPGVYRLYDDGDDCTKTGYRLNVTATMTKDGDETTGISFDLLSDDGESDPQLCRVDIKGGRSVATYDDPTDFAGNATDGFLMAPPLSGGNP